MVAARSPGEAQRHIVAVSTTESVGRDGYLVSVEFDVGDVVVYGTHGVGRVAARKKQVVLGTTQEVVVLELEDGLTVTLPLSRAQEHLRPIAGEAEMRDVQEALRHDNALNTDPWLSRRRELMEKLTGGDPVELAQIVSDGTQRERARRARGGKEQLSPSERAVFLRARKLLCGEIALALGMEPSAAEGWIDEQLNRPVA